LGSKFDLPLTRTQIPDKSIIKGLETFKHINKLNVFALFLNKNVDIKTMIDVGITTIAIII
jgi:hypothetical protein